MLGHPPEQQQEVGQLASLPVCDYDNCFHRLFFYLSPTSQERDKRGWIALMSVTNQPVVKSAVSLYRPTTQMAVQASKRWVRPDKLSTIHQNELMLLMTGLENSRCLYSLLKVSTTL